jgi:hypothetical protein
MVSRSCACRAGGMPDAPRAGGLQLTPAAMCYYATWQSHKVQHVYCTFESEPTMYLSRSCFGSPFLKADQQ